MFIIVIIKFLFYNIINMKKILFISAVILLIILYAFYSPLMEKQYIYGSSIKIAFIADYHSGTIYYNSLIEKLEKSAVENRVDLILLGGDILDDEENITGAVRLFESLNSGSLKNIPKFYVTGNHEFWSNKVNDYKKIVKDYNIVVLDKKSPSFFITVNNKNILISGLDDPYAVKYDNNGSYIKKAYPENWQSQWVDEYLKDFTSIKKITGNINKLEKNTNIKWLNNIVNTNFDDKEIKNSYKILLSHRPEFAEIYKNLPYDYILSGHTHGGQAAVPFILNGVYAPNQGFFPKYAGGSYNISENKYMIVSRGISFNKKLLRIFNRPELVWLYI